MTWVVEERIPPVPRRKAATPSSYAARQAGYTFRVQPSQTTKITTLYGYVE